MRTNSGVPNGVRLLNGFSRRLLCGCLVGAVCLLSGCGYPRVSDKTFELAKLLNTVCNLRNTHQLPKFRTLVDEAHQAGNITGSERDMLIEIADMASEQQWDRAESEARELLKAQNGG